MTSTVQTVLTTPHPAAHCTPETAANEIGRIRELTDRAEPTVVT